MRINKWKINGNNLEIGEYKVHYVKGGEIVVLYKGQHLYTDNKNTLEDVLVTVELLREQDDECKNWKLFENTLTKILEKKHEVK